MQSAQMSQLRQQSMQLLREQAGRLKMQSKEIQLRDEQVRFLKETILALEQEKDTLASQNAQWKVKLKQMTAEITQYNTNVVQKIYEENQELLRQVCQLEQQLETVSQERQEALSRLRESEGRIKSHSSEKQQLSTVNQTLKEARSRHEKRAVLLQKENRDLQSKNIALQRQLDQSSSQIVYCSQQIDVLTQKHHQALKLSEKRLKQTAEKMVPREDLQKSERQAKDTVARNKQLRADFDRLIKDHERLKFELAGCRDRLLTTQIREETRSQQLRIDLVNLAQSIKIGKRVAQFQSDQHNTVSGIYQAFRQSFDRTIAQQQQMKGYAQRLKQTEIQRHALAEELRFRQVQMEQLRQTKAEEEQAREAQYEHRLMELGLKLKREEIALAVLRQKEDELQNVRQQREKQVEQHRIQSEAMGRTIDELRKENFKIGEELSSAIRLCEQNLMSRECVSYFKYVIQDLVGIVYYMHLHLIRSHERTLKLFQPFLNYYMAIHPAITHKNFKKPINRFRTAVYAVIAMGRMTKQHGKGKGLEWYAIAAGQRRQNFENMSQHIQELSSTVLSGGKAIDVLRKADKTYKWRVSNYSKVKLPISDDRKIISQSQIELDLNY